MASELTKSEAVPHSTQESPWVGRLVYLLDILMLQVASHWLAVANLAAGSYVGLAALAPYLEYRGWQEGADVIYLVYSFLCHQQPGRSFFIFGHQVAICHRCVGTYGGFLVGGLLFALLRSRLKPLPWRVYLVVNIPFAVDGLAQLLGLRESTWYLRLITGGVFAISSVWLAYPYIQEGMTEVLKTVSALTRARQERPDEGSASK